MYIVALPFLGIVVMSAYSNIQYRIWPAILVMVAITMSVSAETTKADMALVVGFLVFAVSYAVRLAGKSFRIPVGLTVIAVFVAVVLLIDSVALVTEFFQEADTHGARETLYGSSFGVIEASPIVGHGPGAHVLYLGKYWDVHQTQLAILLQAGLLGLIAFLALFWAIAKRVATNPPLLAAFSTILVYSAGGDILRRLPIWILLILIYYWPFSERNSRTRIGGAAPNAI
jgi:O-antigen ligase